MKSAKWFPRCKRGYLIMCSELLPVGGDLSSTALVEAGLGIFRIFRTTAPSPFTHPEAVCRMSNRIERLPRTCDTGNPVCLLCEFSFRQPLLVIIGVNTSLRYGFTSAGRSSALQFKRVLLQKALRHVHGGKSQHPLRPDFRQQFYR